MTEEMSFLLDYSIDIRTSKNNDKLAKTLHVDLTQVEQVDVLGITVFAANLAKSVNKSPFYFKVFMPKNKESEETLSEFDFESLLIRLGMHPSANTDMWSEEGQNETTANKAWHTITKDRKEALIFVPPSGISPREQILSDVKSMLQSFYSFNEDYSINFGQLHQIFHEIIKNTVDHSGGAGVLGLKVGSHSSGAEKLSFVYCDLGDGISLNVRHFLRKSETNNDVKLKRKGSYSDFLHWAFKPGNTTKPNSGVNAGLGLATIRAAAHGERTRLYLSDARSITFITDFPENHSHSRIRKTMYHSVHIPCLTYFGHTTEEGLNG